MSAFVKTEAREESAWGWLWLRIDGETKSLLDNMANRPIKGTTGWKQYDCVLDVPDEAMHVVFGLGYGGDGRAWVDDFQLEVVGEDVKTTAFLPAKDMTYTPKPITNTPTNLDFERGGPPPLPTDAPKSTVIPSSEFPWGWEAAGSNTKKYHAIIDRMTRLLGDASASITPTVDKPGGFFTAMQEIAAAPFIGKRICLSAYIKTADVAPCDAEVEDTGAGIWTRVDGPEGGLVLGRMSQRMVTGTTDWARYDVVVDIPEKAVNIALGFRLRGKGQAWFDDLKLEAVGNDVETTQVALKQEKPRKIYPSRRNEPLNLDFEK
jgi:hypothetical protein